MSWNLVDNFVLKSCIFWPGSKILISNCSQKICKEHITISFEKCTFSFNFYDYQNESMIRFLDLCLWKFRLIRAGNQQISLSNSYFNVVVANELKFGIKCCIKKMRFSAKFKLFISNRKLKFWKIYFHFQFFEKCVLF